MQYDEKDSVTPECDEFLEVPLIQIKSDRDGAVVGRVFAVVADGVDAVFVHAEAVGGAAISNMSAKIENVTYDDYIPKADSLDDDF